MAHLISAREIFHNHGKKAEDSKIFQQETFQIHVMKNHMWTPCWWLAIQHPVIQGQVHYIQDHGNVTNNVPAPIFQPLSFIPDDYLVKRSYFQAKQTERWTEKNTLKEICFQEEHFTVCHKDCRWSLNNEPIKIQIDIDVIPKGTEMTLC